MKNKKIYIERIAAIAAAVILIQTLYFKFTAHPDSVKLFTELELEPLGRIGVGVLELITGILLLYKKTSYIGAFIGAAMMVGAILSHFTVIGINFNNDGGTLFILACVTFICCVVILLIKDTKLPFIGKR